MAQEAAVQLDANLHAMLLRQLADLLPVRNQLLLPLPGQNVAVHGRPRRYRPVRRFGILAVSGGAGERINDLNPHQRSQLD
ncbi:hypothetical protein D3C86_2056450 [compost metagenome]